MGRTQMFDTDVVIRAARAVFWQNGYDGTSLPALEAATGLSRSSIYHAFGNKRGLFNAAVQSYLDEVIRPRLDPLRADHVTPDAIVSYFTGLREALTQPGTSVSENGCLLVNTAGTQIAKDAAVRGIVTGYRRDLEVAFERGLAAHRPDLRRDHRQHLAGVCTSMVVAAMTLVRIDPAESVRAVDAALDLIDSHSGEPSTKT